MWQGRRTSGLHTMCLTLMFLSFQGQPGPKGEMVRHQLSCLPSEGWETGLAPMGHSQALPGKGGQQGQWEWLPPCSLPSCIQPIPPGPHISAGRRGWQGASSHEKREKGGPGILHAWPVSPGVRGYHALGSELTGSIHTGPRKPTQHFILGPISSCQPCSGLPQDSRRSGPGAQSSLGEADCGPHLPPGPFHLCRAF